MSRLCLGCPCDSVSKDRAGGQAQWLSTGCHGRDQSTPPASDPLGWGLAIPYTSHWDPWMSCLEALSRCERQEAGPRLHLQRLVSSKCLAVWRRTPETQRKMKGLLCWHEGPPCSSEADTSVPQAVAKSPLPLRADGWGSDSPLSTRGSRCMWLGLPCGLWTQVGLG